MPTHEGSRGGGASDCDLLETADTTRHGPYQGLIQAAVALHHFGNGNMRGARKLLHTSLGYLEKFRPKHEGIDLDKFVHQMRICFADVVAGGDSTEPIEIVPDLIPEIHLDPPPS